MQNNASKNGSLFWLLLAIGVGMAMTFIDITGVSVALPTIGRDLHASLVQVHWIMNGFLLGMACLVLVAGRLGDLWGHKKVFTAGVICYCLASILAALSHTPLQLILSRVLQGVGGVCITVPSPNLIMLAVAKKQQGTMIGKVMGIASLFTIIGPFIGGVIVQTVSWRWLFVLNLPLGLVSLLALRHISIPQQKTQNLNNWDYPGFIVSLIVLGCLSVGLMHGASKHATDLLLLISAVGIIVLWAVEHHVATPMIDFSLFRRRIISLGCLILFLFSSTFLVWTIIVPVYLQQYLGFSAIQTGIITIPFGLLIFLSAIYSGKMYDKLGVKLSLRLGLGTVLIGYIQLLLLLPTYPLGSLLVSFACGSLAAFFITSPIRTHAIQQAEASMKGITTAILSWSRQLGNTIGLSVFTLVQTLGIKSSLQNHASSHQAYFHGFYLTMIVMAICISIAIILSFCFTAKSVCHSTQHTP